jgi:hypothetical protein
MVVINKVAIGCFPSAILFKYLPLLKYLSPPFEEIKPI